MGEFTFLQKLGYTWYRIFDSSGFMFCFLKDKSPAFRAGFYVFFSLCFYFSMTFLLWSILVFFPSYSTPIFVSSGNFIIYSGLLATILLSSYEFLYRVDIKMMENSLKKHRSEKKQFWRLRNMNFFFRSVFYIAVWFIGLQFLHYQFLNSIVESNPNIIFTQSGINLKFASLQEQEAFHLFFTKTLNEWVWKFSIVFLLLSFLMEYRIGKVKKVSSGNKNDN